MTEESRFNRVTISFLVVGLIIGFVVGYLATNKDNKNNDQHAETSIILDGESVDLALDGVLGDTVQVVKEDPVPTVEIKDISVSIVNQPAGGEVLIGSISTPTEGWIAVREDRNGELWSILGARKVSPGVNDNITVPLLRDTMPNTLYHVVVYEEDGDGEFNHKADTLVSKDGNFYIVDFTTSL